MAGLVPATPVKNTRLATSIGMPGTRPGMTNSAKLHHMLLRIAAGIEALFVEG
jgi:hypothetical protein